MLIRVNRFTSDGDSTLSCLFIDGLFECFGLEDEFRWQKVDAETRIPAGRYKVQVRRWGGFHSRYADRFAGFHRGMLEIESVPNFTDILIHVGNWEHNTAGCLLVGTGAYSEQGNMSLQASANAYERLYKKVIDAAESNKLEIEFVDYDR